MGADLSRVRFDPLRDLAGVVLQQGRLLLDSDWNELVAIVDRRLRAGIADLDSPGPQAGFTGVAVVPRTTPDAFEVTLTGGALSIGRGRMYVDGLLAENHGTGGLVFDPLLAEEQRATATPYDEQPFGPVPDLPESGTHLAYLDVWQRELTCVEQPDLVDPAIGVDTTARTQTAWQVRLLPLYQGGVTCATPDADFPGWLGLVAPSPARLSVVTDPTTVDTDPCTLPPTGGFRGRENQTYRVEVHDPGPAGTATFKWSRDNGSVVSPVFEVATDGLWVRPASLGRDAILGFDKGDWVEVLDDRRELQRLPGDVRKVDDVVDGRLVFTTALGGDLRMTAPAAAGRHLRVRRWDQNGQVRTSTGTMLVDLNPASATGVIPVPGGATTRVVLENGVTVSLAAGGGSFRTGDHWIFVARVADATVEELDDAPPLGTHHHFARLGVLTFPDGETDCRTLWPPECECDGEGCGDCTVCVTPESHASGELTIQAAVDLVAEAGGTVCLAPGTFHLDEGGVRIEDDRSVRVRGQGIATVVICRDRGFEVRGSAFVTLEDLAVVSSGASPCVCLERTVAATVQRLVLLMLRGADNPRPAIEVGGVAVQTRLLDNIVIAVAGIGGSGDEKLPLLSAGLEIRGNVLACRDAGVALAGRAVHLLRSSVAANEVVMARDVAIRLLGTVGPGAAFEVAANSVLGPGDGIEVGPSGYAVTDNQVRGNAESIERQSAGISVVPGATDVSRGSTRVSGNRVADVGAVAIAVQAPTTDLLVTHNVVERARHGIVIGGRSRAASVDVSHNVVRDVGVRESDQGGGSVGIQVAGARTASIGSNVVQRVGLARESGERAVGIRVAACPEVRVTGNAVDEVGLRDVGRGDLGIGVQGLVDRAVVSGNQSRRQPPDSDEGRGEWVAILVGTLRGEVPVDVTGEFVTGFVRVRVFTVGPQAAFVATRRRASVTVEGNIAEAGRSDRPAILVAVDGDVVAHGNQCLKFLDEESQAALFVQADAGTVNGNRCVGGLPTAASLMVDPARLAVLGNVVSSEFIEVPGGLASPWQELNVYNVP